MYSKILSKLILSIEGNNKSKTDSLFYTDYITQYFIVAYMKKSYHKEI